MVLYSESSVLENVLRGCAVRSRVGFWRGLAGSRQATREDEKVRERALELLHFVELAAARDELARNLPYGHQRALGVAIGLATEPELLMLDEPVAGMNPEETAHMARLIRRVNARGTTIVVVEHDMSFVMQLCREIVVMNYGKKIAEGPPDRIRNDLGRGGGLPGGGRGCPGLRSATPCLVRQGGQLRRDAHRGGA